MTIKIAIESSSRQFGIAIADGETILVNSRSDMELSAISELDDLAASCLARAGVAAHDIGLVGVCLGPGGLGTVRAGVVFANALAFSIDAPIAGFSYFEIAGRQVQAATALPVLSVIPAADGLVYAGLFDEQHILRARFGQPEEAIASLVAGLAQVATAGRSRHLAAQLFPALSVHDSGIEALDPAIILSLMGRDEPSRTPIEPLNETAALFHA